MLALGVGVALIGAFPAGALAGGARIAVRPSSGGPTTRFSVRFTAPDRSGHVGSMNREYVVSANGPAGATNCVDHATATPSSVRAHARVRVILSARSSGGRWCVGRFNGTIEELQMPICPQGRVCPAFVVLVRRLGSFHFRVKSTAAQSDTTPPEFAGIKSAFACTPGPQRPGQTTPFTLRWNPATDNVTPRAKIVYDVFESNTSGRERYSSPAWTTAPGVTTFRTPGLASHGTFYFVVRARDRAGNEDANRVERRGSDPCL